MVETLLIVCFVLAFDLSAVFCAWWIRAARRAGLTSQDMHQKRAVSDMGGLPVTAAFLFVLLLYMGLRTFLFGSSASLVEILGVVSTVLLIALVGLMDDILGWKIGLAQWQKPVLCLFAALPLMMINAGTSTLSWGAVDLGIWYALLVIPLALSGAANGFNLLAGYNGLEAGQGIIILSTLGFLVWQVNGNGIIATIAALYVIVLLGFLLYNWYPARLFPGDTLTYVTGAMIAIVAILGNAEKAAFILFIPYFLEFFLKARSGWKAESFARVGAGLQQPYAQWYGLEHIAVALLGKIKRVREQDVVYALWGFQLCFVFLVFVLL